MSGEPSETVERINPRTRRVQSVILDAAVEVLLHQGAQEVTAQRVAERADVARTTIYRHWPDQGSLLLAAIDTLTKPDFPASTSGNMGDDLRSALENLRIRLAARDVRSVFGAIAANAGRSEDFAAAQRRFVQQLAQPTVDALEAARDRGDLGPHVDVEFEAAMLAGPILHEHLLMHNEVTARFTSEILERWLASRGTT